VRAALFAHRFAAATPSGVGRYAVELAAALRRQPGLDLVLASAAEHGPPPPSLHGLPIAHLRGPRQVALARWLLFGGPPIERVTGPVDVVHQLAPFVPVPSRAPLVATVHDLMPIEHPSWYRPVERAGYRRGLAAVMKRAARVIVDSARVGDAVVERYGFDRDRMTVIPAGVGDAFRRRWNRAEQEQVCRRYGVVPGRFVIAVGAMDVRKNLGVLVGAARGLDVTVLLAGAKGEGWPAVEEALQGRGTVKVRAPGYVAEADLPVLVASARVLAHPSLDEGFGLPPLEAMAAGTPVVLARAGALPEVAGDAALWVDPHDEAGWREALGRVIGDDALHAQLTAAGARQAEPFTWERAAFATAQVYRDAVSASRA
jgi:alpha-1,3-rhamnosyl/mannosyltransferase